jgi:hypothetical protein
MALVYPSVSRWGKLFEFRKQINVLVDNTLREDNRSVLKNADCARINSGFTQIPLSLADAWGAVLKRPAFVGREGERGFERVKRRG